MPIELLTNVDKNTGDWLALRKRTIGSSDIAGICGLNPYRSPLKIWMEKTGKIEAQEDNDTLFLGRAYEPIVAKMFARRRARDEATVLLPANALYGHSDVHWATCTPDYFYLTFDDREIVECKTSNIRALRFWDNGEAPDDKRTQVIWQLGILEEASGYLAALIGGFEYREVPIEASPSLFGQLMEIGDKFMEYVKQDIPPTAGPNDKKLIQMLHSELEDKSVELSQESLELFTRWEALAEMQKQRNEDMKYLNEQLDKIENNLRLQLGAATHGTFGPWEIRIKKSDRKGYSVAPTIAERVTIKNIGDNN